MTEAADELERYADGTQYHPPLLDVSWRAPQQFKGEGSRMNSMCSYSIPVTVQEFPWLPPRALPYAGPTVGRPALPPPVGQDLEAARL